MGWMRWRSWLARFARRFEIPKKYNQSRLFAKRISDFIGVDAVLLPLTPARVMLCDIDFFGEMRRGMVRLKHAHAYYYYFMGHRWAIRALTAARYPA